MIAAVIGGAAACVPLDNLDDYSPTLVEGGAGGTPPEMNPPGGDAGGSGAGAPAVEPSAPGGAGGGDGSGAGGASGADGSSAAGGSAGPGSGSGGSSAGGSDAGGSSGVGDEEPPSPALPDGGTGPDPGSRCAPGELEGAEGCFFLDAQAQTFFAARSACRARGAGWDLASVRSAETSALLGDTLSFEGWLVGSDVVSEGTWVWLDDGTPFWQGGASGSPVGGAYTNWNASEPNGATTTNCLRALPRSSGSANPDAPWADLACTELRGAICRGPLR